VFFSLKYKCVSVPVALESRDKHIGIHAHVENKRVYTRNMFYQLEKFAEK